MKNFGAFNPLDNPLVPGGIPPEAQSQLISEGWKRAVTAWDVTNVLLGFKSPDSPSGYTVKPVDFPPGIPYIYNPRTGEAILSSCGNPTCWRWMVND